MYVLGLLAMLMSYYSIDVAEIDEKFMYRLSILITISSVLTILFNGMLNPAREHGVAFSGRINPFMYLPYIFIVIRYTKNNLVKFFLYSILILNFIDIVWTDSRASIIATIFIFGMYFIFHKWKDKDQKKILKVLCLLLILVRILLPISYIALYKNYANELNAISYKYTKKYFFSGRQLVWTKLYESMEGYEMIGTGDVNYEKQSMPAHNEFLNLYYCYGLPAAICADIIVYIVARRAINNMNDDTDLLIILCFLSNIICTIFESYLYVAHFFVFNIIPIAYVLKRKEGKNEGNIKIVI